MSYFLCNKTFIISANWIFLANMLFIFTDQLSCNFQDEPIYPWFINTIGYNFFKLIISLSFLYIFFYFSSIFTNLIIRKSLVLLKKIYNQAHIWSHHVLTQDPDPWNAQFMCKVFSWKWHIITKTKRHQHFTIAKNNMHSLTIHCGLEWCIFL